ncbi:MAG TPA: RecQ family ATP-dependent DNA helicase [Microscillaceae bacterium]|jgi:ATP-dependent DNA helicase RecQ|nr:RecQ family ATP-dependent DNA helicase [Microscillaceae bacterium]
MTRQEAEQKLKSIFGFDRFHDTQWAVIEKLQQGKRILLIEKTGFGKSLCYQFPATQLKGLTIVFSPLIALMRDQVQKMQALGIDAGYISSQQPLEENAATILAALDNKLKLLYIHPSRMENVEWLETVRNTNLAIAMVVVDEAHCISTWGHDFIPSYRKIVKLVNLLPANFPVLATTATATPRVEEDIKTQIGRDINAVRGNLLRPNLNLVVIQVQSEEEKLIWLGQNLSKIEGTGIIYTGTRANTEIYAKWLSHIDIPSVFYNAGVDTASKKEIELALMQNTYKCIVSTNALGMGIDKPDIRFVIHTQTPISPIHYYQEIGRAGRDGKPSFIILFYNPNEDQKLPLSFIESARPHPNKYAKVLKVIKAERLGFQDIAKAANIKSSHLKIILADLVKQGIVLEAVDKRSIKYEWKYGAQPLDTKEFEELKNAKLNEFAEMLHYITTPSCRMKFLCDFLGDNLPKDCQICDNCRQRVVSVKITPVWQQKLTAFIENDFPVLEVGNESIKMMNGVAASYYGFSQVGQALHRCKYENGGDFPEWLVKQTLKAFGKYFAAQPFDVVLYVPPTESGDLVKNFAEKIAKALKINILHTLKKNRDTQPQKKFETNWLKTDNLKNVFYVENPQEIAGKCVLLVDDIFDSGATIKEIGKYLASQNVACTVPLVIAKTINADLRKEVIQTSSNNMGVDLQKQVQTPIKSPEDKVLSLLKKWRTEKATELNLPKYMVIHYDTLRTLSEAMPSSILDLLDIKGMGKVLIKKYGQEILEIIRKSKDETNN